MGIYPRDCYQDRRGFPCNLLQWVAPRATGPAAAGRLNAELQGQPANDAANPQAPPHPTPPCPAPTADDALRHIPGLDVTAGLRRVLDKRPAYEGLLRKFVAGQAHAVQATRTALAAGQHDEAQRAMHTRKGTAGNIGATALAALAQRAEEAIAQKTSSSRPRRAPHRTTRSSGMPRRSPTATRRNGTAQATPRAWWTTLSRRLRG